MKNHKIDIEEIWKIIESKDEGSQILGLDLLNNYHPNWTRSKANRIRMEKLIWQIVIPKNESWGILENKWVKWNNGDRYDENIKWRFPG